MKKLQRECLRRSLSSLDKNDERYKHFSFIVIDGKIVSMGCNLSVVPPIHYGYAKRVPFPKFHSEVIAWKKARGLIIDRFDLINVRLSSNGEMRLSKPCECCQVLMTALGMHSCYFTANNGWERL